jgi:hypothetical protein
MKYEIEDGTRKLIESVVSRHLDGHELVSCNIVGDIDGDGGHSIEIGLRYKYSKRPIDPAKSLDMLGSLSDALLEAGDARFPYLEHFFDDKQQIKNVELAC